MAIRVGQLEASAEIVFRAQCRGHQVWMNAFAQVALDGDGCAAAIASAQRDVAERIGVERPARGIEQSAERGAIARVGQRYGGVEDAVIAQTFDVAENLAVLELVGQSQLHLPTAITLAEAGIAQTVALAIKTAHAAQQIATDRFRPVTVGAESVSGPCFDARLAL